VNRNEQEGVQNPERPGWMDKSSGASSGLRPATARAHAKRHGAEGAVPSPCNPAQRPGGCEGSERQNGAGQGMPVCPWMCCWRGKAAHDA